MSIRAFVNAACIRGEDKRLPWRCLMHTRNEASIVTVLLLAASLAIASFATPSDRGRFFEQGKLRALIFSGRNNHDWRTTTPFLRKLLVDSRRFDVRVCEEPVGTTAETLAPYDLLVLDYGGPRWGEVTEKAVESFVRSGKGMVVVHGASYSFGDLEILADGHARTGIKEPPWTEFARMVGGRWPAPPAKGFHGERHSFAVKLVQKEHPILRGMADSFIATDELYHSMEFLPETKILATAFDDPRFGGTGRDEPMLCTVDYGKGRVFYTALGHEVPAMSETGFKTTFLRGAEWAASGRVTLPPDIGDKRPQTGLLRLLVVTGGHDYESSFYTVFEDNGDWVWTHAASNREAFKSDLRGRFDVLVLYDASQELEEAGRRNLQDFLESGKGLVVLHHAILDYGSWPWWYREVVGGKYLLQPEGSMAASTYMHDQDLIVQPTRQHPITNGIGHIHIRDETYKGMWISQGNEILLKTDNPTSDGPLAWVSPYAKSRVVYVALGHDSSAHRHPAYRLLVKNSILWSAGRLH
jgi:type 1 glutamine amidotransferase